MNLKYWLAIVIAIPIAISGCGGGEEKSSSSNSDDPTDPSDPTPPGVVNESGFYVKVVDERKFAFYMNKGTSFNSSCLIPNDVSTNTDLTCTIDVQEGDLNFHGIELNYNVSPSLCTYMRATPYYYYNYEPGVGPSRVTMDVNVVGSVSTVTACSATDSQGAVIAGCAGQLEVDFDTANLGVSCKYDNSAVGGENCCFGNYTSVKNITGDRVATETTRSSWGGSFTSCLGGPEWPSTSSAGLPRTLVYFSDADGLNGTYKIVGPLVNHKENNFTAANYFSGVAAPGIANPIVHTHSGYLNAPLRTSSLPYAVDPVEDRDGSKITGFGSTTLGPTNPSYKYECLDQSFEVKHRIQVYIREWNTYSQFLLYGTSNGVTGNPDVSGVEGVDCAYSTWPGVAYPCNDGYDWDDLLNVLDADFNVTTDLYDTTIGNEAQRSQYFPSESDDN